MFRRQFFKAVVAAIGGVLGLMASSVDTHGLKWVTLAELQGLGASAGEAKSKG